MFTAIIILGFSSSYCIYFCKSWSGFAQFTICQLHSAGDIPGPASGQCWLHWYNHISWVSFKVDEKLSNDGRCMSPIAPMYCRDQSNGQAITSKVLTWTVSWCASRASFAYHHQGFYICGICQFYAPKYTTLCYPACIWYHLHVVQPFWHCMPLLPQAIIWPRCIHVHWSALKQSWWWSIDIHSLASHSSNATLALEEHEYLEDHDLDDDWEQAEIRGWGHPTCEYVASRQFWFPWSSRFQCTHRDEALWQLRKCSRWEQSSMTRLLERVLSQYLCTYPRVQPRWQWMTIYNQRALSSATYCCHPCHFRWEGCKMVSSYSI